MDFGQNLFNLLGKMDICNDFVKAKKQIHPYSEWICLVPGYVVDPTGFEPVTFGTNTTEVTVTSTDPKARGKQKESLSRNPFCGTDKWRHYPQSYS